MPLWKQKLDAKENKGTLGLQCVYYTVAAVAGKKMHLRLK